MKTLIKKILPPPAINFARNSTRRIAGVCLSNQNFPVYSDPQKQIFFGYYDISPLNADNTKLLAMRAPAANESPHINYPELEIGYFDLTQKVQEFRGFGMTRTWNWQQGCRLQWFDKDSVIYNTENGAVIQDLSGKTLKTYERNIYALDHARHFALSLDFARLHDFRRGYGYSNIQPTNDGVTRIDLRTGKAGEIIPLDQIRNFQHTDGPFHYINHLAFNPSGTRFMLFHVWTDGGPKRSLRLLTANPDGTGLYSPCPYLKPSHYSWMNDEQLLITATRESKVIYAIVHDKIQQIEAVESPALRQDGHPSVLKNGAIVSDTYPDIFGRQKLFTYQPETARATTLATFHSPVNFTGEMRCDLHPRPSPDQSRICVDIVKDGRRALCIVPVRAA